MLEAERIDLHYGAAQALWGVSLTAEVTIARALVTRPRLLILDEPTEGIQPSIIKDIGNAIRFLRSTGDMAILLVEQYLEFAQELADTVFVLDRGRVVASGDPRGALGAELERHMAV